MSKPGFINHIAFQAALIIIGLSMASLVLSVFLYRESMREIALKEVENKATIFLSAMETSVRRLAMEKNTKSLIELIQERAQFIDESLNFAIVGVIVRDADGKVLEHKIKDPDGLIYDPGRPKGMGPHPIPKDFQEVIDSKAPLVKRQVKQLKMVEGQPVVRVIEALYPITKRQKGELLAVIKLVISVERTFELIRAEYEKFTKRVILGFSVATLLLIVGLLFFLRRRIIVPVLSINEGANQVASGNLEVKLVPSGSNEISSLMGSFNKMVEGLKQRDQMRRSLEVAMEVQQNLLPHKNPQIEGLDIAGISVYCDETGGDYYDFIEFDNAKDSRLAVVIGDVSGHGISSALLMASTRAFLRQRSALPGTAADILSDVNTQLSRDVAESGSFMTMFYLIIDQADRSLRWVRAGHDPAVLYDPELDVLSELRGPGIALGVDEDLQFEENSRSELRTGQIILLGTDGIWEACNPLGEMFGKEPIYALLREYKDQDATQIVEKILEALHEFQQGATVEDDVTLIVIKLTENF
ncbi:MAG: SpoIIE family protein phosphatase [Desulfofustis sp.]|nr:SpoIIE family protein phosphatase [Desulfofustis sp.]